MSPPGHALLNSAELPTSGIWPAVGTLHGRVGELCTQVGFSAIDGMYCMFTVISGAPVYIVVMFVHEPLVVNTSVIGLGVLSRSLRPSAFIRLVWVSPVWKYTGLGSDAQVGTVCAPAVPGAMPIASAIAVTPSLCKRFMKP